MGGDEPPQWVLGMTSCSRMGAGVLQKGWKESKCEKKMKVPPGKGWLGGVCVLRGMYGGQLELGREKQQQTLSITHALLPSDQTFCRYIKGKQLGKPKL